VLPKTVLSKASELGVLTFRFARNLLVVSEPTVAASTFISVGLERLSVVQETDVTSETVRRVGCPECVTKVPVLAAATASA
jgi:hypothetical protein